MLKGVIASGDSETWSSPLPLQHPCIKGLGRTLKYGYAGVPKNITVTIPNWDSEETILMESFEGQQAEVEKKKPLLPFYWIERNVELMMPTGAIAKARQSGTSPKVSGYGNSRNDNDYVKCEVSIKQRKIM